MATHGRCRNLYSLVTSGRAESLRRYDHAIGEPNWLDQDEMLPNLNAMVAMGKGTGPVFVWLGNVAWAWNRIDHVVPCDLERLGTVSEPSGGGGKM